MHFGSAMAYGHVAGSGSAFTGVGGEASLTLPLTTPIAIHVTIRILTSFTASQ
jgi:hypothetical protein